MCVSETKRCYERKETKKREGVLGLPVNVFSTFPFSSSFCFEACGLLFLFLLILILCLWMPPLGLRV